MRALTCAVCFLAMGLGLTACGDSQSGNPGAPVKREEPAPRPGPAADPAWGQLQCQARRDCADPVLNLRLETLSFFLESKFNEAMDSSFACGKKTQTLWEERFPSRGEADDRIVGEFLMQVLDVKTCLVKENLSEILNQYFRASADFEKEKKDVSR